MLLHRCELYLMCQRRQFAVHLQSPADNDLKPTVGGTRESARFDRYAAPIAPETFVAKKNYTYHYTIV